MMPINTSFFVYVGVGKSETFLEEYDRIALRRVLQPSDSFVVNWLEDGCGHLTYDRDHLAWLD